MCDHTLEFVQAPLQTSQLLQSGSLKIN